MGVSAPSTFEGELSRAALLLADALPLLVRGAGAPGCRGPDTPVVEDLPDADAFAAPEVEVVAVFDPPVFIPL